MKYPVELCQLIVNNMAILEEAPSVIEHVEEKLFDALNEHIKARVTTRAGWTGCYEFYTGDKDQTTFAPAGWPTDDDGWLQTYFTLYRVEAGEDYEWLSSVIGLENTALTLQFMVKPVFTGLKAKEYKKLLHDFYSTTPALAEAGFLVAKNGTIYRPFALDAGKVAEEYPDFDEAFTPLSAALDDLFKVYGEFDNFVKKLK